MKTDKGDNPYLVMDAGKATPLYAYVKGVTAKQFYLELTAQVTGIRSDEGFPKFGLMISDGREMVKFYNQVVYTTSRVSMTESTVKFTGYNVGTTTIENLSVQVFKSQQVAQSYLAEKN